MRLVLRVSSELDMRWRVLLWTKSVVLLKRCRSGSTVRGGVFGGREPTVGILGGIERTLP